MLSQDRQHMIARIYHEAQRAYMFEQGDDSQLPWDEAPPEQREAALAAVDFRLKFPTLGDAAQHNAWIEERKKAGWQYGHTFNEAEKLDPRMAPYHFLPIDERMRNRLCAVTVAALSQV